MRKLLTILGLFALTAAACVTAGANPTGAPTSAPTPTTAPTPRYQLSMKATDLILRVQTAGGLVAPGFFVTAVPQWAMYGDGRVFVPGPVVQVFPGPLLPNLRVMQLTPDEMQKVIAAADAAGLLGPNAHFDIGVIADAGTTTFSTTVDGKVHTISAYALGMDTPASADPAVTAARAKLAAFESQIADLSGFLGRPIADAAYVPTGMRVFVGQAQPSDPSQPTAQTLAWPLSVDPASGPPSTKPGMTCLALTGSDLSTFERAAATANTQTVWTFGRAHDFIQVRPLYPNESGC